MHLLLPVSVFLILSSFSGVLNKPKVGSAEGEALASVLHAYVGDGAYTKKSHIRLNTAALAEAKAYFHEEANTPKRRTYYNETVNALLMGDYDGGFEHINSGYAKVGDDMDHYQFDTSKEATASSIFSERIKTYTVTGTSPNEFFVNLSALESKVQDYAWTVDGAKYTYTIADLSLEGGNYKDELLHDVQYFAAPMMLQSVAEYLSPKYLVFEDKTDYLSIQILSDTDAGKLDEEDGMGGKIIAESFVYKGIVLE